MAAAIRADGGLDEFLGQRYSNWDSGLGAEIESGKHTYETLFEVMSQQGDATANASGRQEFLENYINRFF